MFGAIALGQSFGLSLFSGDAALGLLGFAVLIVISLFLTGVFAIIMFVGAMANWPKRAKESGARDDGARNSP
jgi:ABC-type glycerol-3-phosphate transport system permease component